MRKKASHARRPSTAAAAAAREYTQTDKRLEEEGKEEEKAGGRGFGRDDYDDNNLYTYIYYIYDSHVYEIVCNVIFLHYFH